jgi:hypothetical protein
VTVQSSVRPGIGGSGGAAALGSRPQVARCGERYRNVASPLTSASECAFVGLGAMDDTCVRRRILWLVVLNVYRAEDSISVYERI